MGVPGLTTFVDAHARTLLTDKKLFNTGLIIDGNNLYHFLYYHYKVRHECAGDYDVFKKGCSAFFETLSACRIKPFVIFDGAHAQDGRKFRVSLDRAEERIHMAGFLSYGRRGKILPILAYEVFIRELDALNIPHVTCYLEADGEIAGLAQEWGFPVLTNDSDFFVYDLPAGVVLLDYVNLTLRKFKSRNSTRSNEPIGDQIENNEIGCGETTQSCALKGNIKENTMHVEERILESKTSKLPVENSINNDTIFDTGLSQCCHYINIQIFYREKLVTMYKLKDSGMVTLAATVLGNDVVNRKHFENFYSRAKLVKQSKNKKGSKASLVDEMLKWLKNKNDITSAVNEIISALAPGKKEFVTKLIHDSIRSYTVKPCSMVKYLQWLESKHLSPNSGSLVQNSNDQCTTLCSQNNRDSSNLESQSLRSNPSLPSLDTVLPPGRPLSRAGNSLPLWFLDAVCSGAVPSRALSVLMSRSVILLTQVEVLSLASSYTCASVIREFGYGILLSIDTAEGMASDDTDKYNVIEWGRDQKNPQKRKIPFRENIGGIKLPKLSQIPELPANDRFEILMSALLEGVVLNRGIREQLGGLSTDVRLLMGVLIHWVVHASPGVSVVDLKALMLCHLCLGGLDEWMCAIVAGGFQINSTDSSNSINSAQTANPNRNLTGPSNPIISELKTTTTTLTNRFSQPPTLNRAHRFDGGIVHRFSQYQACLQAAIHLERLLLVSRDVPDMADPFNPANLFNGTFLYNLSKDLEGRVNPDLYIEQLIGRGSPVCRRFHELVDIVMTVIPAPYFEASAKKRSSAKTKNRKEEPTVDLDGKDDDICDDEDDEDDDDDKENCDNADEIKSDITSISSSGDGIGDVDDDDDDDETCDSFADCNNRFSILKIK